MDGISEPAGNSHFITADGNVLIDFNGNTAGDSVGCHNTKSCPRAPFSLERRGSGKRFFPRCFVKQNCYPEKLSGNVTKCIAHVGH